MTTRRTVCDCAMCRAGCKSMPGYLVPDDVPNFDVQDLRASEGALVVYGGEPMRIATLVPAQTPSGHCVFFNDGKCSVHGHSPFGCRAFSACEPESAAEYDARQSGLMQIFRAHQRGEEYHELTATLPQAPPLAKRKAKFERLLAKAERRTRKG